jgi:succinoglycan biosynthesis protein ExoM
MDISVCIASFRRPGGLYRLLESLERQAGEIPDFEVVVVDNDHAGTASSVYEQFQERIRIRYFVEPLRGIARARNRCVRESFGKYLAFIDDDEEASPCWLSALYTQATHQDADAVFGPVVTRFERPPPPWIRDCSVFNRPIPADGATVPVFMTHTGNALVRRKSLPDQTAPFDPCLLAGEDTDMFDRMIKRGAKCTAATAAVVIEHCPVARARAAWVFRRRFRFGGSIARRKWRGLNRARRLREAVRAGGEFHRHMWAALSQLSHSRIASFESAQQAIQSLGKIAWVVGFKDSEYGL